MFSRAPSPLPPVSLFTWRAARRFLMWPMVAVCMVPAVASQTAYLRPDANGEFQVLRGGYHAWSDPISGPVSIDDGERFRVLRGTVRLCREGRRCASPVSEGIYEVESDNAGLIGSAIDYVGRLVAWFQADESSQELVRALDSGIRGDLRYVYHPTCPVLARPCAPLLIVPSAPYNLIAPGDLVLYWDSGIEVGANSDISFQVHSMGPMADIVPEWLPDQDGVVVEIPPVEGSVYCFVVTFQHGADARCVRVATALEKDERDRALAAIEEDLGPSAPRSIEGAGVLFELGFGYDALAVLDEIILSSPSDASLSSLRNGLMINGGIVRRLGNAGRRLR